MHPQFDLLAEVATQAILDGYYREAAVSYSASLERFYEFYVRVIFRSFGIPDEEVEKAWKQVRRQSERQLGLFIATYVGEKRSAPLLLSESAVAFRNSVVHQGHIPTEMEAINFGQEVIDITYPLARELFSKYHAEIQAQQKLSGQASWDFAQPGDINMSAGGGMIYNLAMTAPPVFDLKEALNFRRSLRKSSLADYPAPPTRA